MLKHLFTKKYITCKKQLTKLFNSYMNIVEKSSGTKPKTFGINFGDVL